MARKSAAHRTASPFMITVNHGIVFGSVFSILTLVGLPTTFLYAFPEEWGLGISLSVLFVCSGAAAFFSYKEARGAYQILHAAKQEQQKEKFA